MHQGSLTPIIQEAPVGDSPVSQALQGVFPQGAPGGDLIIRGPYTATQMPELDESRMLASVGDPSATRNSIPL